MTGVGGGGVGGKGVRARCDQNLLYSFVKFINNEQSPVHDGSTINTMVMIRAQSGEAVSSEEQPAMLEDGPAGLDCRVQELS